LDTLCDNVLADLTAVIQAEIAKFSASDSLHAEVAAHKQFGELRGGKDRFKGRENLLRGITDYLNTAEPNRPLVIFGPAGTGKSAVIARAAQDARDRFPQAVILERFIGATPPSVDGRSLLQSRRALQPNGESKKILLLVGTFAGATLNYSRSSATITSVAVGVIATGGAFLGRIGHRGCESRELRTSVQPIC